MNLRTVFSLSVGSLVDRKTRTIFTVLMVVLGCSLVVVLEGLSAGQAAFLEKKFSALAANVLFVSSGQHSYKSQSSTPSLIINSEIVSKIRSLPYIDEVIPEYSGTVQIDSQGNTQRITVYSFDPTKLAVESPNLGYVSGSTLNPSDTSAALVGDTIANPPGASTPFVTLGQTIKATYVFSDPSGKQMQESKHFIVTGIMKPVGNTRIDRSIIINQVAGNQLLHKSQKYDSLVVVALTPDNVDTVQQEITDQFGKTLGVTSPKAVMAVRAQAASGNALFILMIGMIALVVGAVGIVTTLYNSVIERIREIGTMKAIGAQNTTILKLFLAEAALIGAIGATLGLVTGVGGGYILSIVAPTSMPGTGSQIIIPIFVPTDLLAVWFLSISLSICAGIYPAWKASRLSPMVALRRE